jgi:signal transduction histidine kinase
MQFFSSAHGFRLHWLRRWPSGGGVTHADWIPGLLALVLLAAGESACAKPDETATVHATLAADGRSISVKAPGWSGVQGGYGASIIAGGEKKQLAAAAGTAVGTIRNLTETTPCGEAAVAETTLHFEKEQVDLLFRMGRVPGVPGVLAQAGIRNIGRQAVELVNLTTLDLTVVTDGLPAQWLITGFHNPVLAVTALNELVQPLDVHEAGGFYGNGQGFWFGAVGTPTAYVNARFTPVADGKVAFKLTSEMSGVRVDPGETRWGQQAAMLMEPPQQALARWAEWVGKTHGARTTKGALAGWNSWNFLKHKDPRKEVLEVVAAVRESGGRLRPGLIQIEDMSPKGREVLEAQWLPEVAQRVGGIGARFGLRLAFDQNLNPEVAGSPVEIHEVTAAVRNAVQSGINYLKISCEPAAKHAAGDKRTAFEIQRADWSAIRQAAGEDTYLLFCSAARQPDRAVVGCVDASRIGPDAGRRTLPSVILDLRPYDSLNGRWFAVDHDVYYLAADAEGMAVAGGQVAVQTWRSIIGLSGGAAITADPWYRGGFRENWRNAEVLTPPTAENARVLGFGTAAVWNGLVSHVRRDWGGSTVVLVWNSGKKQPAHKNGFGFAAAGMDPKRRYAVWSFWDNQFLGTATGAWTTPVLAEAASQHLCFTDLDRTPNQPVLIGSNLHIYCGAAEIKGVTHTHGAMRIDLTDAGARDGDLWVYSRWPLAFKAASGCALKDVVSAGDNVWRISLVDRQHGQPQRVDLEIRLPLTRQVWFWLVLALVLASLVFGAWRYVVALRLQREHGLDAERARIARNIHDDLGASLTEITLLSELAQSGDAPAAEARSDMRKIAARARQLTQALDTTVWAVNPRNDTLGSLVSYIGHHAEDFLKAAGIRCRMDVPNQVPERVLTATVRHDVFLVVKEALHNVVKHSGASEVALRMTTRAGGLTIVIEDNGKGFDTDAEALADGAGSNSALRREGRGLSNMRQRAADIGATLAVRGIPARGTRVQLDIIFHPP